MIIKNNNLTNNHEDTETDKFYDYNICPICLEIVYKEMKYSFFNCSHKYFHSKCITSLSFCPLCREPSKNKYINNKESINVINGYPIFIKFFRLFFIFIFMFSFIFIILLSNKFIIYDIVKDNNITIN